MGIIYCAKNKINGKRYIGKTKLTLPQRKSVHKYDASKKLKISLLHRAINKYGWDNIEWSILYEGDDYSDKEYQFISSHGGEYNIVKNDNMQNTYINNPNLIEIRKKLSEIQKIINDEKRSKISEDVVNDYNNGISTSIIYKKYKLGRMGFLKIADKYDLDLTLCRRNCNEKLKQQALLNHKPKSLISEKSYHSRVKNLGNVDGIHNPKWSGYWLTPVGKFNLIQEACLEMGMAEGTLRRLCKDNNERPLDLSQIRKNKWLKNNNVLIGQTPKILGFGFQCIK